MYYLDELVFRPDELVFKGYRTSSTICFCMDQQMHLLRRTCGSQESLRISAGEIYNLSST